MIPLTLLWVRWLWRTSLQCGLDARRWAAAVVRGSAAVELAAVAPIETATLLWVVVTWVFAALDRWAHFRLGTRRVEPFALLAALALGEELYLRLRYDAYFTSLPWQGAVAYVSANHFLFGLHHVLGRGVTERSPLALRRVQSFCEDELEHVAARTRLRHKRSLERNGTNVTTEMAGVGGMLRAEQREHYGFLGAIWSFNEHRLADVWVHFGVVLMWPWRLDHIFALVTHIIKYSGYTIPRLLSVPCINGCLSLDNVVDCIAHTVSGIFILGWPRFAVAVVISELHRWLLDAEVARHSRHQGATAVCSCPEGVASAANAASSTSAAGAARDKELKLS